MTKNEVFALIEERKAEESKTVKLPHYYKRNGKMLLRSYPDYVYTDRYKEVNAILRSESAKIFRCVECEMMVNYDDLEHWLIKDEKSDNAKYLCSCCYEEMMGEDL